MERSPLSLTSDDVRFCVIGTVTIHPTAAIATNVVLRANPGSSLVIGAGVVVGQGCVLHANGGELVLDNGVALGTQVLMFGQGRVGERACIGSFSTLMVTIDVRSGEMIPARTLVDTSSPRLVTPNHVSGATAGSASATSQSSDNALGTRTDQGVTQHQNGGVTNHPPDPSGEPGSQDDLHGKNGMASPTDRERSTQRSDHVERNGRSGSHNMFMPLNTPRYSTGTAHVSPNSLEIPGLNNNHTSSANSQPPPSSAKHSNQDPTISTSESPLEQSAQEEERQGNVEESKTKRNIEEELSPRSVVYGKSSVQRLMTMMFPYRTLNNSGDEKE